MMLVDLKNAFSLFEIALTSAICLIYCIESAGVELKKRKISALFIAFIFFIPIFETSTAGLMRGVTGDFSITSLLLLWSAFFVSPQSIPAKYQWSIILIAIIFYPCALGLSMFDPYSLGYGSYSFFTILMLLGCCMWFAKWYRLLIIFSFSILAWCISWHESTNLWDYLLDPFFVMWCVLASLTRVTSKNLLQ